MTTKQEIRCDGCDEVDINYTSNCEGWFLQLSSVSKSPWYVKEGLRGGAVTSMAFESPLDGTKHFCSVNCLRVWLSRGA